MCLVSRMYDRYILQVRGFAHPFRFTNFKAQKKVSQTLFFLSRSFFFSMRLYSLHLWIPDLEILSLFISRDRHLVLLLMTPPFFPDTAKLYLLRLSPHHPSLFSREIFVTIYLIIFNLVVCMFYWLVPLY